MPTTITKTVGCLTGGASSGRDYTSVGAAITALKAGTTDLVAADQAWVIELYNDGLIEGGASLTGITVDATRNVTIRAAAGHSFKDNAGKLTNALRYNPSNGVAWQHNAILLNLSADYTVIEGLQMKAVGGSGNACISQNASGPNTIIRDCIFETNDSATGTGCTRTQGATHINCLGVNTAGGTGFTSNGNSSKFRNCTAIQMGSASAFGFRGNYDSPLYVNCAAFGFGTCFRSGTSGSSNYNASSDATAPGANNFRNLTFASQFQDVAGTSTMDFRTKSGNGLQVGTRDQAYTLDLDVLGQSRSTSTPTIGAHEYVITDTTAPVLTSPTGSQTGSTSGTGGATTDEANGTFYAVASTSSTAPSAAQIKAGQMHTGAAAAAAASVAVSSTGAKSVNFTGLSPSTGYYVHSMHEDAAANQSNVVSSSQFTTTAGSASSLAPPRGGVRFSNIINF